MLHPYRMFYTICAITVLLFALPTMAGIGDKDLPLLNGAKTKLVYTVVGVADSTFLATTFHCTSTERTGGSSFELGIEVFNFNAALANDVTTGSGAITLSPGQTATLSTKNTAAFSEDGVLNTGAIYQGSARIFASSKNVVCSAMLVDPSNAPPTSMVMLAVFRVAKQRGM